MEGYDTLCHLPCCNKHSTTRINPSPHQLHILKTCMTWHRPTCVSALQKQFGEDAVRALSSSKGFHLTKLLQGDPEFDSELESPEEFFSKQGLQLLSV